MGKKLTTLTTPGTSEELSVQQYQKHLLQVVLSGVQTNVVVRVEGSFDKVTWENLDEDNLTLTVDDTYNLIITDARPLEFIRFNWVSESGGAGAQIALLYAGRY